MNTNIFYAVKTFKLLYEYELYTRVLCQESIEDVLDNHAVDFGLTL